MKKKKNSLELEETKELKVENLKHTLETCKENLSHLLVNIKKQSTEEVWEMLKVLLDKQKEVSRLEMQIQDLREKI